MPQPRIPGERPNPPAAGIPPQVLATFVIVVMVVGVFLFARMFTPPSEGSEEEPQNERPSPFADLPPEDFGEPRQTGGNRRPRRAENVPAELAEHADWGDAQSAAREGALLAAEAEDLQAAGDFAAYRAKADEAKERYERALELTALWAERLQEKLGEDHPEVLALAHHRTQWRKQMFAMRK